MSNVLICSDALLREVYFQIDAELPLKKYMLKVFLQVIVLKKKKKNDAVPLPTLLGITENFHLYRVEECLYYFPIPLVI